MLVLAGRELTRHPVAAGDDVGEWGPPAAAQDAPELPALVRPPIEEGGAEVRRARGGRHSPSGRGLGERGRSRGAAERAARGDRLRERRRTGTLVSSEGLRAAGCCSLVLSDPLLAVSAGSHQSAAEAWPCRRTR